MAQADSFLHLARPVGPTVDGLPASTAPLNVTVHPQALLSILDHSTRRNMLQNRVIGTLLGTRSEDGTDIEIRNCFAVPHTESDEEIQVGMDYEKQMRALHVRANPKEVLLGWYITSPELNSFSPLIHSYYGHPDDGTWPHPAIHLTVSAEPGKDIETRVYITAPVGVSGADDAAESYENRLFIPVPHSIRYGEPERAGLELMSLAKDKEDRSQPVAGDIDSLERSVVQVLEMLETVSGYVNNVLDEEADPSIALGQYLMNALSLAPKVDMTMIERDFNNHVMDVLAVTYLTNTIRAQIDLSNRLATATAAVSPETADLTAKAERQERRPAKTWGQRNNNQ